MEELVFERLTQLPPLDRSNAHAEGLRCKICDGDAAFFDLVDYNKCCSVELYPYGQAGVPVPYYRCGACGFIFTTFFDTWTRVELESFLYNYDYAKVDQEYRNERSERVAHDFAQVLAGVKDKPILYFGARPEGFVRTMERAGFPVVRGVDPLVDIMMPQMQFGVVVCVKVLEHAVDPLSTLRQIRQHLVPGGAALLRTALQPKDIVTLGGNWWYIAPRNGHVSIFSHDSLHRAAQKAGFQIREDTNGEKWLVDGNA